MIEHKTNIPTSAKVFMTTLLMFCVFGIAFAISLIFADKNKEVSPSSEVIPKAEVKLPASISSPTITPTPMGKPVSEAKVEKGCKVSGCNSEVCLNENDEVATTICLYKKRYECYQSATCKVLDDGDCGWVMDSKLTSCISKMDKEETYLCGGISGTSCPDGYTCELDGAYPDASGTCVQEKVLQN